MGLRNTETEYGSLAKSLHWIIAIGILALIFLVKNDVVRRMTLGVK